MTQSHHAYHYHHRRLPPSSTAQFYTDEKNPHEGTSKEWLDRSLAYYSKVMRENEQRRRLVKLSRPMDPSEQQEDNTHQCIDVTSSQSTSLPPQKRVHQDGYLIMAAKHYFALRKIKDGKPHHAELIYRRILAELQRQANDEEQCDHAKLAVTTLLLALLLQRLRSSPKDVRSVFLNFFRVAVVESSGPSTSSSSSSSAHPLQRSNSKGCACSAKVLQAYALFEMKHGNSRKSLQLVMKAIEMDPTLEPVLSWKQFRDALGENKSSRQL